MKIKNSYFFLFLVICAAFLSAEIAFAHGKKHGKAKKVVAPEPLERASQATVKLQKDRLARLQESIDNTRSQLNATSQKENSVNKNLDLNRKQSEQLASYLHILQNEIGRVQDSIHNAEHSLGYLQDQLQTMQKQYADLCEKIYKAGETSDAEALATGKAGDEELRNSQYMKNITTAASDRAREITALQQEITSQKNALSAFAKNRAALAEQQEKRNKELQQSIVAQKKALKDIRSDKASLQKQLEEKNRSAAQMKRIISRLIEKEIQRSQRLQKHHEDEARRSASQKEKKRQLAEGKKSHEKKSKNGKSLAKKENADSKPARNEEISAGEPIKSAGFHARSLPWPVGSHSILHKYGKNTNPITKTVTDNLGIGIKIGKGSSVQSVGDGFVSLVHWLPGYGSLVIVDHGNGFRTVYANLSAVTVAEGQRLKTGGQIGRSGESVDGEYVHFEIWREREKLNPSQWLN